MDIASPIIVFCFISAIIYLIYRLRKRNNDLRLIRLVTPLNRGERSERSLVLTLLKSGINPKCIFHDLYLQKPNGEYTQIDVAVATKAGIIVFEVKEYCGWIFGDEHQQYWTKIMKYGKDKYRFYNPVMQNSGHINVIRQSLPRNPEIPIYSVIVFYGDNELKKVTCKAPDTYILQSRHIEYVVSEIMRRPPALYGDKYEIMNVFTAAVGNGNNPLIVSSQIEAARYYGRDTPQPTHKGYLPRFFRFRGFRRRKRKFW